MAHEWVVGDRMFPARQLDEGFIAHQYVYRRASAFCRRSFRAAAGAAAAEMFHATRHDQRKNASSITGPTRPCLSRLSDARRRAGQSQADLALLCGHNTEAARDDGGAVWVLGYQAVKHIRYGPDWKNVIHPNWKFITDVRHGELANFAWITPVCSDSDHINCPGLGPSWVTALVNTVGQSKFWDSTAIFRASGTTGAVLYDHVPPPYEGRDGVGFRVPLLIISPYARANHVTHVQYETASVLALRRESFRSRSACRRRPARERTRQRRL